LILKVFWSPTAGGKPGRERSHSRERSERDLRQDSPIVGEGSVSQDKAMTKTVAVIASVVGIALMLAATAHFSTRNPKSSLASAPPATTQSADEDVVNTRDTTESQTRPDRPDDSNRPTKQTTKSRD